MFDGTVKIGVVKSLIDKKQNKKTLKKPSSISVCAHVGAAYISNYTRIFQSARTSCHRPNIIYCRSRIIAYIYFFFWWIYRAGGVNNNLTSLSSSSSPKKRLQRTTGPARRLTPFGIHSFLPPTVRKLDSHVYTEIDCW